MKKLELLSQVKEYFLDNIFDAHKKNALGKNTRLSSYRINPILVRYLSKVLVDDYSPEGIAKALYFPRVLGTSMNTTFGDRIQKVFVELGLANGSLTKGIDIEFIDKVDNCKKWCQLKSGPNTINSDDVSPILKKFKAAQKRARLSKQRVNDDDLIVGVLYGEYPQLSRHYMKIDEEYPVVVGSDFWHRLRGCTEITQAA